MSEPVPPADFLHALRLINPNLRLVWGQDAYGRRYYNNPRWIIEVRVPGDYWGPDQEGRFVGEGGAVDLGPRREYDEVMVLEDPETKDFWPPDNRTLELLRAGMDGFDWSTSERPRLIVFNHARDKPNDILKRMADLRQRIWASKWAQWRARIGQELFTSLKVAGLIPREYYDKVGYWPNAPLSPLLRRLSNGHATDLEPVDPGADGANSDAPTGV